MNIKPSDLQRIDNDINGNPRYYLGVFLTSEIAARKIGAVKYRGKKYGPGWVFQSYSVARDLQLLNELNRAA